MMEIFEMIRSQLGQMVPFAAHVGVAVTEVGDGTGKATLEQTTASSNHIGSQHAGALFTLGEAASGAALAGAFAAILPKIRPVAANASIRYKKIAKGEITASASTSLAGEQLRSALDSDGRVAFEVNVSLVDTDGNEVAEMKVDWDVRPT